jgi:hypothetical protein
MNMAYPGYSLVIDGSSARSPKDSRALVHQEDDPQ